MPPEPARTGPGPASAAQADGFAAEGSPANELRTDGGRIDEARADEGRADELQSGGGLAEARRSGRSQGERTDAGREDAEARHVEAGLASLLRLAETLEAAGDADGAQKACLQALRNRPDDPRLLLACGILFARTGHRSAACNVTERALALAPGMAEAHLMLGRLRLEQPDPQAARDCFETALRLAPGLAEAHKGLGAALDELGARSAARRHWRLGYGGQPLVRWPYRGPAGSGERPPRVLLLCSAGGGNVRARLFLDDRVFAVSAIATDFWPPGTALPSCDLIVNAIGDADLCAPALRRAARILRTAGVPVVNRPEAVLRTGRLENARRLGRLDGVVTPAMARLERPVLLGPDGPASVAAAGLRFPLLLRAPGFHTGQHFVSVPEASALAAAAAALPGRHLLGIERLDASGPDGLSRKYRVMLVGGRLYPLHLAISRDWKVHYATSDMESDAALRDEERVFLRDMPGTLGAGAMAALGAIAAQLGLEYGGIDFALDRAGRVILFEANATMAIVPPADGALWDYRRAATTRVNAAVRGLLAAMASPVPGPVEPAAGSQACPRPARPLLPA